MRADVFTAAHVRAVRAWLGWSAEVLAEKSNCGVSTIRDFERGARTPIRANLRAMRTTFEAEDIVFTEHGFFQADATKENAPTSR